ncbi:MAG: ABC transporter permease [Endomicrobia bacterium]|nr:ABC transporter permease [Endomicrobiia bacterium]
MLINKRNYQYLVDLITELAKKELKVRYKNSFLGYLWSILSPLTSAVVFFVAFKIVIKLKIENYVLFLISGLFCWQWFTNSLLGSANLFLNNANLIKKVSFPRDTLVYSMVINDMVHFILSFPVIFLFMGLYRQNFSYYLFLLPIAIILQFFFVSGMSLIISSINLFFRDLERLVVVFTNLLFYATPIIYSEEMVPLKYKIILSLNPMANFVILYRDLLLSNRVQINILMLCFIYSIGFFYLGYNIYKNLQWKFAEII